MTDVLQVRNLTKKFGQFTAVNNISFSMKEGEILGFLGRNGAGKTTSIQMLLGVLTPTTGEINYFGKDLLKEREYVLERINFSSTYTNLPYDLFVKESLTFSSYLYDISNRKKRVEEIIELFRLKDLLKTRYADLSAGQQTRVNLAKSFINFPKVLLLDEPTASLDPEVADYLRKFLLEERKKFNVSILFTSHNMAEVEEVCDRVMFIDAGKIIADDTPEQLAKTIDTARVVLLTKKNKQHLLDFCKEKKLPTEVDGNYVEIEVKEKEIAKLLIGLTDKEITFEEISIKKPTLEDYFLHTARKGKK